MRDATGLQDTSLRYAGREHLLRYKKEERRSECNNKITAVINWWSQCHGLLDDKHKSFCEPRLFFKLIFFSVFSLQCQHCCFRHKFKIEYIEPWSCFPRLTCHHAIGSLLVAVMTWGHWVMKTWGCIPQSVPKGRRGQVHVGALGRLTQGQSRRYWQKQKFQS